MSIPRKLSVLGGFLLALASQAFAHEGGPSESLLDSQMFAYIVASLIGGGSYIIMVWETPSERKRKEQQKR